MSETTATVQVDALTGTAPGVALGGVLSVALGSVSQPKVGDRLLAVRVQGEWMADAIVDASGHVPCQYAKEAVLTPSHVTQLVMSANCSSDFEALIASQGIKVPECHDTGCQQAGLPSALVCLLAALGLRRFRRALTV